MALSNSVLLRQVKIKKFFVLVLPVNLNFSLPLRRRANYETKRVSYQRDIVLVIIDNVKPFLFGHE